jgi:hypothetical protein
VIKGPEEGRYLPFPITVIFIVDVIANAYFRPESDIHWIAVYDSDVEIVAVPCLKSVPFRTAKQKYDCWA